VAGFVAAMLLLWGSGPLWCEIWRFSSQRKYSGLRAGREHVREGVGLPPHSATVCSDAFPDQGTEALAGQHAARRVCELGFPSGPVISRLRCFPIRTLIDASPRGPRACAELLGLSRVALLFLTRGDLPHSALWAEWLGDAAGLVPLAALKVLLTGYHIRTLLWSRKYSDPLIISRASAFAY